MAKTKATVSASSLRAAAGKIVVAATRTKEYKARIDEEAQKISHRLSAIASEYYDNAISTIADVAEGGIQPATSPMGTQTIETPEGRPISVVLGGGGKPRRGKAIGKSALSASWLKEKKRRASGLWQPRKNSNTGRSSSRGVSYGPDHFWLDTGKLGDSLDKFRGLGSARVVYKPKNRRGGETEITFRIALNRLPSRYLDLAIRRSLVQGAGGPDRVTAILDFGSSHATISSRPRGVGRGFWPEVWRPTMRPIAQRLGRALKKQLIKTINRR